MLREQPDELDAAVNTELAVGAECVRLGRTNADPQRLGDLSRRLTQTDPCDDFGLARCQGRESRRSAVRRRGREMRVRPASSFTTPVHLMK